MKLNIDFNKMLNKILVFILKLRDKYFPNPEIMEYDLEDIREAFEDYIGLIIVSFKTFNYDIEDIEDKIFGKMLAGIKVDGNKVYMQLSDLSGNNAGQIMLVPTMTGQFIETDNNNWVPTWATRYKLSFVGGACIEYVDGVDTGKVSYSDVWK